MSDKQILLDQYGYQVGDTCAWCLSRRVEIVMESGRDGADALLPLCLRHYREWLDIQDALEEAETREQ